jgi:hypothetical protein
LATATKFGGGDLKGKTETVVSGYQVPPADPKLEANGCDTYVADQTLTPDTHMPKLANKS